MIINKLSKPSLLSLILVATMMVSCVAVVEKGGKLDSANSPEGKSTLFVVISGNIDEMMAYNFELKIDNGKSLFLSQNALNRIYIDEGWHSFLLPRIPQDNSNSKTSFNFEAGKVYRYTIIRESITVDSSSKYVYSILPSSRESFDNLLQAEDLPIISVE
jgi:hypothetical protein